MLVFHHDDSRHEDCHVIIVSVIMKLVQNSAFFVVWFGLETCYSVSGVKELCLPNSAAAYYVA